VTVGVIAAGRRNAAEPAGERRAKEAAKLARASSPTK
jgi:hypothetical protein